MTEKINKSMKAAVTAMSVAVVVLLAIWDLSAQQSPRSMIRTGWMARPTGSHFKVVPDPYSRMTMRVDPGRQDAGYWAVAPKDGDTQTETVVILFRTGSSVLEIGYMDNAYALSVLDRTFSDMNTLEWMDYVTVTAAASPDGSTEFNERLAAARAMAIKNYIMWRHPHVNRDRIVTFSAGEDWNGLRTMIEEDSYVPARDEALRVLGSYFSGEVMHRRLRAIMGGATYRYLAVNMFPYLRGGGTCMIYYRKDAPVPAPAPVPVPAPAPTPAPPCPDTVYIERVVEKAVTLKVRPVVERESQPLMALKTNLLFDAVSAVNFEVEVPIGQRWSVAGEYIFPWWLWNDKQRCIQTLSGNLELRYRPGDRTGQRQMTGWFMGLYGGGGYYDLEWGTKGYQGEFFITTGVSGGYAHTVNKKGTLRMEYSLGLGYMRTKYREYVPKYGVDDQWHLIRQQSGNYTWVGPTRAKISLVWMLRRNSCTKGGMQ